MKIAILNLPWTVEGSPELWGVRAGSRWPHLQRRAGAGMLPRYVPFPFFMASAAALADSAGHETLLIDAVASDMSEDAVASAVADFKPGMIFIETSTPSLSSDIKQLGKLKALVPDALTVCGGSHSPQLAASLMEGKGIPDFWIAGEYEEALSALASALDSGGNPSGIPGLIVRGGALGGLARVSNLDALPHPQHSRLPVKSYSDPVCGLPSPSAQSWLSRGCPFKCSFCVWPQTVYGGHDYRVRGIDAALDEVETLIEAHGCESYYFDDDTANIGERRMEELCARIEARGLSKWPWAMMARADCMTPPMITDMAKAGMYAVKYGVESFSPKLIDACGKATRLDKLFEALDATKRNSVKMHLTFTLGLPGETEETIEETLKTAIAIAPESAQFSVCTPFPGTKFYDDCLRNGWLVSDDWSRFLGSGEDVVVSTPQLPAENLKSAYERVLSEWRRFLDERLERRRRRLLEKIAAAAKDGSRWHLAGDMDFASFILDSPSIPKPAAKNPRDADFIVVASAHDEERTARRIARDFKMPRKKILGLYNDE